MTPLPSDLLDLPAATGVRRVALHFLSEAATAYPRLDQPDDPEALHDFRVAVRRLRSAIRSYDAQLADTLPRKLQRRLRAIARATGTERDAEVHAAWTDEQRASLTPEEQAGASFFARRLDDERHGRDAARAGAKIERFPKLRRRLAKRLRHYTVAVDVELRDREPTYADVTASLLHELAAALDQQLATVCGIDDQAAAHDARIAGKRLRYAIEPLVDVVDGADAVVRQLKRLQDAFGELHDAHVFGEQVGELAAGAEAPDAGDDDPRPGLAALAARLHQRRDAAFTVVGPWLDAARRRDLLAAVGNVARRLAARGAAEVEVERKYLLRALPDEAAAVAPREIEQGYLPGERLVERLRRVRAGDDEQYFRTVKLGVGVRRTEVEEGTTRELFEALWPLTVGRRVYKRRHVVRDGGLTWEIDDFGDRELVLAEVELADASPDTTVVVPDWLAPLVVRDVTDEPEYVNARLAR